MDFYAIKTKEAKDGTVTVYPDFMVGRSKDLMIRGKSFYAIWDEDRGIWSTDEYDVQRLVDADLNRYAEEISVPCKVLSMKSFNTKTWSNFKSFMQNMSDNSHPLDEKLIFSNTEVQKTDYASKRLSYPLEEGNTEAWSELLDILYSNEERDKIEWAIGAVVSGEAKKIQKFLVFYGPAGSGKSTILNIIQHLFEGYTATFDAKALGSNNGAFATEVFRSNPLVAIQHDGDLSRIDDNTKLNSIISHEDMTMNEKYKPSYTARVNAFLFMGTNQPVKISDAKSGIIRRLIDIQPSGHRVENGRYNILMSQIEFELGAIAHHCLSKYKEMGKNYYGSYRPLEMMLQTDVFYNYVEACYDILKAQDGVTLKQAYSLYKEFCEETGIDKQLPQYKFREELRNYFDRFQDRAMIGGAQVRSYYSGFKEFGSTSPVVPTKKYEIIFDQETSILDKELSEMPAQYGKESGFPGRRWENVNTILSDIETDRLHYVKLPEHHIVVDFDLVDEDGEKDLGKNVEAASELPPTYSELSKSGSGVHLHYIYSGNVHELASVYATGIEVKTLLGDSSLRRKLTKCNNLPIATISGGLPKKETPVLDVRSIQSEKGLRDLIARNLKKEIHPGTKPSVDFIQKILEDAHDAGLAYDLTDMKPVIFTFASMSTNQAAICLKTVQNMKFTGKNQMPPPEADSDAKRVFFDVEVYPNLFVVCWKYEGSDEVVKMINPSSKEVEELFSLKLIGFNNRRYDNHILYGRFLGYSLKELYLLSQKIISGDKNCFFREAYNISYTDIYDFSSKKQGLKKFQIELGIQHMELDIPWDDPVDEELWPKIIEYCANDVVSTEKVFESREQDFVAREILSELSGLSVNHSTQSHTAKIIFGEDKYPQNKFVYTDLSKEFKGYKFDGKESTYRGEVTGEGGYVYAEPGIYENVALLDVASMHPTSIETLNLFGPYTEAFSDLKQARMAIKHKDYEKARSLLGGKLQPFLGSSSDGAEGLSYALKIVINIVYGLTSARFENAFKDKRNIDNIVAKRGALFMIDLKHAVQEQGYSVVHIKTDSIKIPNATKEIIDFVTEFGKKYGYDFEHEITYEKFCLVNDAVYIAKSEENWTAVGAQFQHPYVFKTLFSKETLEFKDFCETKNVTQGIMYLDPTLSDEPNKSDMIHVGRTGSFTPVTVGGGLLWRVKEDKYYAVTGTKGYCWQESEVVKNRDDADIDNTYFENLADTAVKAIEKYGSFEAFVS